MIETTVERLTVTVSEAARMLGISRNLAYELIKQNRLPAIRISEKRIVVPKAALQKLLTSWGMGTATEKARQVNGTSSEDCGPEQTER